MEDFTGFSGTGFGKRSPQRACFFGYQAPKKGSPFSLQWLITIKYNG